MGYPFDSCNVNSAYKEEVKCPICFDLLEKAQRIVPCGHAFCEECLPDTITNCPTCREPRQGTMKDFLLENLITAFHKLSNPLEELLGAETDLNEITDGLNVSMDTGSGGEDHHHIPDSIPTRIPSRFQNPHDNRLNHTDSGASSYDNVPNGSFSQYSADIQDFHREQEQTNFEIQNFEPQILNPVEMTFQEIEAQLDEAHEIMRNWNI